MYPVACRIQTLFDLPVMRLLYVVRELIKTPGVSEVLMLQVHL